MNIFSKDTSTLAFNTKPQKTTKHIARKNSDAIAKFFDGNKVLVRGTQSIYNRRNNVIISIKILHK